MYTFLYIYFNCVSCTLNHSWGYWTQWTQSVFRSKSTIESRNSELELRKHIIINYSKRSVSDFGKNKNFIFQKHFPEFEPLKNLSNKLARKCYAPVFFNILVTFHTTSIFNNNNNQVFRLWRLTSKNGEITFLFMI